MVSISDDENYATDWILLKPSPENIRVYYEPQEVLLEGELKNGVQFYVDSSDPNEETLYYRYDWTEWWIYAVPFPSTAIYMGNDSVYPLPFDERLYRCWTFEEYEGISIANSERNDGDVIARHPLNFVTSAPEKLKIRFGLRVRQYALTEEEYRFWEGLEETSAESGSLFDVQPQQVVSNLVNLENPGEPVFGYFSVCGVSKSAGFVNFRDLPFGVGDLYTGVCRSQFLTIPKSMDSEEQIQEILQGDWRFYQLEGGPPQVNGYTFISAFCGDCTIRGGFIDPPDWWVE